jgi:hypothetical protein
MIVRTTLDAGVEIGVDRATIDATSGEIVLEIFANPCARVAHTFERQGASTLFT